MGGGQTGGRAAGANVGYQGDGRGGYACFSLGSEEQGLLLGAGARGDGGQQSPRDGESEEGVKRALGILSMVGGEEGENGNSDH